MAVKLNNPGYEHAQRLVRERRTVLDQRDAWSEHQPSARQENDFIAEHGSTAYGRWYLAVDDERPKETKGNYKSPTSG